MWWFRNPAWRKVAAAEDLTRFCLGKECRSVFCEFVEGLKWESLLWDHRWFDLLWASSEDWKGFNKEAGDGLKRESGTVRIEHIHLVREMQVRGHKWTHGKVPQRRQVSKTSTEPKSTKPADNSTSHISPFLVFFPPLPPLPPCPTLVPASCFSV